ncbi:MAG: restriction endonuclease subunit S [Stenomitos rutilans HA7619-LM2]|jgi:type I restriction enzyme S subunit|nr:restriction endonuclease subunit S [Stenomitos rutilans HA7619-LM2]
MPKLTASQQRYLGNATLIAASKLIFQALEQAGTHVYVLVSVAETTSGGTPDRGQTSYYGGSIPWIKSGELNDGLIDSVEEYITEEGLENSSAKIYPKGTLVIALYGATVGKTGILGLDAASNQAVCAVTPIVDNLSNQFLFWFFRSKRQDFLNISFGGAQPNISQKLIRETLLPIPDIELQNQICEFLEAVETRQSGDKSLELPTLPPLLADVRRIVARVEELAGKVEEARELRSTALEEAALLLNSALVQTFDQQMQVSGWESKPLKQAAEVARGKFTHRPRNEPRFYGGEIPFIQIGDISSSNRYIRQYTQTLNEDGLKISRLFPVGTVVIAITGATIGVTGILTFESCFPDSIVGITPFQDKVTPEFLHCAVNYTKKVALEGTTQTTQPNMNLKDLEKLTIPIPPLSEQHCIVAYLDDLQAKVDGLKQLQTETEAELNALLPSILDKAFKGEL